MRKGQTPEVQPYCKSIERSGRTPSLNNRFGVPRCHHPEPKGAQLVRPCVHSFVCA